MPELPEVETIRLGLQKHLVGKTITDVDVRLRKIFSGDEKNIVGAKVIDVKRFGKGLVIDLDNNYSIAIHIKLTGQLIFQEASAEELSAKVGGALPNKFTHVIFTFQHGTLFYNDMRQFGWVKILKSEDLHTIPFFKDLGPEPFKDLNLEIFKTIIQKSNLAIKVLIMDQKKISGIGNIYANDGLWLSKINPKKKAKSLDEIEIKTLYESLLHVLKEGLKYGGASELQFVNALGRDGSYQKHFLAYAQDGKPCQRCKTKMIKYMLSGRGTYVCPACQR